MKKQLFFSTQISKNDKKRLGITVAMGLIIMVLLGIGLLLIRDAFSAPDIGEIQPARDDEFLVAIARFDRRGGERYDFGTALKDDLEAMSGVPSYFRVASLAATPDAVMVSELMQHSGVRIVVTGNYDETAIDAWVYVAPPTRLPARTTGDAGLLAMFLDVESKLFHIYAPRGIGHPLQYLQYWLVGLAYFQRGEYDNAEAAFRLALQITPGQIPVAYRSDMDRYRAAILWEQGYIAGPVRGDWQDAGHYFSKAQKLDASSLAIQLGEAASLSQTGAPEQALEHLTTALRTHPDAWQLYFALAQIRTQQNQPDDALSMYDRAIGLLTSRQTIIDQQALADVYFNRGYFYYQQGDLSKALVDYQQARALGRNDSYLLSNLGWTAYLLADYETAVAASAEAAALAPDQPDLAFNKALHLLARGDISAAQAAYSEAIQLTLGYDDVLTRSTYFGGAYQDLQTLAQERPDLQSTINKILHQIDVANG